MKLGVRFGHGCQDPVDSENRFESAAPPCSRSGRRAAGRRYYLIAGRLGARSPVKVHACSVSRAILGQQL
ncbi:hypothetical protein ALP99_100887 [Pseudomonas syringae pv. tomato]|uniref:Uncharacterized protein n=5 Tax=Pseudomonas syringae group TaxID=136849 RepID=A0A0P9KJ42_9PSED|nr:Unknown protein sequence [Pseudomonas syringae pv. maculicola]KPB92716.1 Unknown protein sequence [Pseudomonas syringae pv. maculicola str. M6]KPC12814.1 Unknown protein sequence [Pseudomonas amygdali pv. lachrymans]KPW39836.1 hypothetical protein ALO87_100874 [Pseudomonas syringae pv. apii]KPW47954.1 hypothetical protein ALO88_100912 [Pseudomonas syringae pv. antirrhini]KPW57805.1 hypothetical protein ALO86_100700 [Pseudomonas syringae pv. berberidis]KPY21790.1 hypothetical protein ALO54_